LDEDLSNLRAAGASTGRLEDPKTIVETRTEAIIGLTHDPTPGV